MKTADFLLGNIPHPKRISLGYVEHYSWHPYRAFCNDFLQTARLESSCFLIIRLPFASGPSVRLLTDRTCPIFLATPTNLSGQDFNLLVFYTAKRFN